MRSRVSAGAMVGVMAAAFVAAFALPLSPEDRGAAQLGIAVGGTLGLLALLLKVRTMARAPDGARALMAVLRAQALSLVIKLGGVVGGALVLRADERGSPVAYVLGFFAVYLAQQTVELVAINGSKAEV